MVTRAQKRRLARVQLANKLERLTAYERNLVKDYLDEYISSALTDDEKSGLAEVTSHVTSEVQRAADILGLGQRKAYPGPRLRQRLEWIGTGILTGSMALCRHIKADPRTPRPVFTTLSRDLIHCGCSIEVFTPEEEFTCDICREYHEGDCAAQVIALGPLTVAFGICSACTETEIRYGP